MGQDREVILKEPDPFPVEILKPVALGRDHRNITVAVRLLKIRPENLESLLRLGRTALREFRVDRVKRFMHRASEDERGTDPFLRQTVDVLQPILEGTDARIRVEGSVRVMKHSLRFIESIRFQGYDGEFHEVWMGVPLPVVTGAA